MRTSTLACSRCAEPVDPADRVCGRCGQPRMGAVVAPAGPAPSRSPRRGGPLAPPARAHRPEGDSQVVVLPDHTGTTPSQGRGRDEPAVPPVVLLACALLVVATGIAAVALWLGFSGSAPSGGASPAAVATASTPSSGAPPAPAADPPAGEAAGTGSSLTGSASAQVPATSASAVDGAGAGVGYAAANMLDGDPTTTWRMDGAGAGQVVTFALDGQRTVEEVGLVNGYAKTDPATGEDRYAQTRRVTRVTWTVGGESVTQDLRDGDRGMQTVEVPPTTTGTVVLRIDAVTAPGARPFDQTAVSEVSLLGR